VRTAPSTSAADHQLNAGRALVFGRLAEPPLEHAETRATRHRGGVAQFLQDVTWPDVIASRRSGMVRSTTRTESSARPGET